MLAKSDAQRKQKFDSAFDFASRRVTCLTNNCSAKIVCSKWSNKRLITWDQQQKQQFNVHKFFYRENKNLWLFFIYHPMYPFFCQSKIRKIFFQPIFGFRPNLAFFPEISFLSGIWADWVPVGQPRFRHRVAWSCLMSEFFGGFLG